jgi:hypothetical protein
MSKQALFRVALGQHCEATTAVALVVEDLLKEFAAHDRYRDYHWFVWSAWRGEEGSKIALGAILVPPDYPGHGTHFTPEQLVAIKDALGCDRIAVIQSPLKARDRLCIEIGWNA